MDKVKVRILVDGGQLPEYKKPGDAGCDVRVVSNTKKETSARGRMQLNERGIMKMGKEGDYLIRPGQTLMMSLGFRVALPEGYEFQVRSRSGLAREGLVVANAPGTVDSGYRGPMMVLIRNNNISNRIITSESRVAQLVLKRAPQAEFEVVDSLDETARGDGGFGSTGTQ